MGKYGFGIVVGLLLAWLLTLGLNLVIALRQAPLPEAILVLGGDPRRELAAAKLATRYPHMPVWVSSGEDPARSQQIFQSVGLDADRVHLDYSAADTVTNFTTLVPVFKRRHIRHLYVVTSEFHMPRARAIGTVVLGSQGILFTPVAVESDRPSEPRAKIMRDLGRSVFWLATGRTGSTLRIIRAS